MQKVEAKQDAEQYHKVHRDQGLDDALGKTSFIQHIDPAHTAAEQIAQQDEQSLPVAPYEDQDESGKEQKTCQ